MNLMTQDELRALLLSRTDSAMISMIAVTDPDMLAKSKVDATIPNPFRIGSGKTAEFTVCKINKVNGNIASRYDRVVENRLEKKIAAERVEQGLPPLTGEALDAEVAARFRKGDSWHRPIFDETGKATCLSVNKKSGDDGPAYLRFIFKAKGEAEFLSKTHGESVPVEKLSEFLSPPSKYENQGLGEDAARFVVYGLESIVEIAIDGERYRITDNFTAYPATARAELWRIADEYLSGDRKMKAV